MSEILTKVAEVQGAIKELRDTHEANLKARDVLNEEKNAKINDAITALTDQLDKLQRFANRTPLTTKDYRGRDVELTDDEIAHKKAFNSWVRKGKGEDSLLGLEQKSPYTKTMRVGDDTSGGFFVPREIDAQVLKVLQIISPMRQVARVINVSTPDYQQFVNLRGSTTAWVGEEDTRSVTANPTFAAIRPSMGELQAMPKVTQQMLDDANFDIESFLADELSEQYAIAEGAAFLNGDAIMKPKGLLTNTISVTADKSLSFGTIGAVKTGVNGAFAANSSTVNGIDVFYAALGELKPAYRTGAQWMFNRKLETAVRTQKDGQGNYIWSHNELTAGWQTTLIGMPYVLNEDMPDYTTTGANAVLLGNFQRCYTIVDRFGIRTLRDPFTAKPYVQFYSTKRVGGMVTDTFAVKAIQFAA